MFTTSSVSIINVNDGINGTNGQDGAPGAQGVGIVSEKEQWYLSTSSSNLTGGSWSDTEPSSIPSGKYLWGRIAFTMSNGTTQYSDAVYRAVLGGVVSNVDEINQSITNKVWQSDITTSINTYDGSTGAAIRDRVSQTETDISGITTRVYDVETETSDLGTRMSAAESSITQNADNINLKVSKNSVISEINQSPESITISAEKLDLIGNVTFSMLDSSTQSRVSTAESNASTAATNASNALNAVNGSIKSTTMHYLATTAASGVTRSTSGWTTTVQSITSSKRYLWTYQTITKVDNTTTNTDPVISGVWGNAGSSITVSSNVTTYQVSNSGTTTPTGTWQSSIPSASAGQYLWTRVVTTFSDNSTATSYSVAKQGETGSSVTVSATSTTYQSGTSGTTAPTGTWSSTIPTVSQGNYLWTKTVVTYSDGNSSTSYAVSYQSEDGDTGVGVVKVEQLYRTSNSTTAPAKPTSVVTSTSTNYNVWTLAMPAYNASYPYYYTCTQTTYTDNSHNWTDVARSKAIEDANTTANTANTNASSAVSTANTANTNASAAVSTANTANTNASAAVSTANSANTTATSAINGIKAFTGTSSTAAGTAAKVVSCSDTTFAMTNGVTITVTFSTASTADSPTLNVNSLGAKAIYFDNAVTSSSNKFRWQAGSVITFQYNGTYWVAINFENLEYFTSSTASGTAAKTNASATGTFVLCKGTTISVYFSTANTANAPTLNIGSTGAFAIYYKNAVTSASNQYYWEAGITLTFTYSGLYWYINDGGSQLVKAYAKSAVDWVVSNGTTTVTATDIMKAWVDDATLATTTIAGGYIKTHTIESEHLATDAIMSSNFVSINGSHFSSTGSYLDLSSGNFFTPNFGVSAEAGSQGAYINGDVVASSGKIGSNTTNYWEIGTVYDFNASESAAIIGHGTSYIQSGNWQLSNNRLNTQYYSTTAASSGNLKYYKDSDTNTFYDVGLQIPTDFTSTAPANNGARYAKSFFYGRKYTGNSAPTLDNNWTYFYLVDIAGNMYTAGDITAVNIYSNGEIYEGGTKLSEKYAALSDVGSVYLPKTGGTITGNLTVNGSFTTNLMLRTNLASTSAGQLTGSANATVSHGVTGTLGVGNGGTGKSSWTQWGVVYASATNALAQASTNASGQILQSNVSAAPSWVSPSTITVGRATGDADGNTISTTYRKLTDNNYDTLDVTDLNAGELIVTGVGRFTNGIYGDLTGTATSVSNNIKIQLNGGTTEGTNQFTYNGSAAKTVNITKSSVGLGNVENTAISTWAGSSNLTTTKVGTLAAAATKAVDSSISAQSTSANLPTSAAVASFVEGKGYVTSSGVTSITLTAGAGISLSASGAITSTGTRTITNSGVREVTTGSTPGTISVNKGGDVSNVSVNGLGSWAYKSSGSASDVGLNASQLVKSIASNNDGKLVLTYFDNSTSDPIEVMIVGSSGSSVSYSDALNVNGTAVGSSEQPVYFNNQGKPATANKIPKLNNGTTGGTFYAPTATGSSGQYLKSSGTGAPTWATFSKSTVGLGNADNTADANKRVKGANITTTANAVAYYTDTTGTFGSKASANGALYATSANGALNWGTLPIAQGGTGMTSATSKGIVYATSTTALATTAAGSSGQVLTSGGTGNPSWTTATNANTASAIVKRDASGNFSAGTITASLSGNATTATTASNVSGAAGTVNSARHVWFSDSTTETVRNYDDDFKYNPNTNTLTVANVSGNATSATKATQDGNGAVIASTYAKLSGASFTGAVSATSVSASSYISANSSSSGSTGGLSLYGSEPTEYGIAMRTTSTQGKHGYVQDDNWATYFFMRGTTTANSLTRGWIFKNYTTSTGVASINGEGNAVFNGSVTIGGNTTNTSGCRLIYSESTQSLDFVFN